MRNPGIIEQRGEGTVISQACKGYSNPQIFYENQTTEAAEDIGRGPHQDGTEARDHGRAAQEQNKLYSDTSPSGRCYEGDCMRSYLTWCDENDLEHDRFAKVVYEMSGDCERDFQEWAATQKSPSRYRWWK